MLYVSPRRFITWTLVSVVLVWFAGAFLALPLGEASVSLRCFGLGLGVGYGWGALILLVHAVPERWKMRILFAWIACIGLVTSVVPALLRRSVGEHPAREDALLLYLGGLIVGMIVPLCMTLALRHPGRDVAKGETAAGEARPA